MHPSKTIICIKQLLTTCSQTMVNLTVTSHYVHQTSHRGETKRKSCQQMPSHHTGSSFLQKLFRETNDAQKARMSNVFGWLPKIFPKSVVVIAGSEASSLLRVFIFLCIWLSSSANNTTDRTVNHRCPFLEKNFPSFWTKRKATYQECTT